MGRFLACGLLSALLLLWAGLRGEAHLARHEGLTLARALDARACDFLHVSSGGVSPQQQIPIGPGYQVHLAARLRSEVNMPVIAVGLITEPEQAETIIASGQADLVGIARAVLFEPHWPWRAAAELGAQVTAPRALVQAVANGDFCPYG